MAGFSSRVVCPIGPGNGRRGDLSATLGTHIDELLHQAPCVFSRGEQMFRYANGWKSFSCTGSRGWAPRIRRGTSDVGNVARERVALRSVESERIRVKVGDLRDRRRGGGVS